MCFSTWNIAWFTVICGAHLADVIVKTHTNSKADWFITSSSAEFVQQSRLKKMNPAFSFPTRVMRSFLMFILLSFFVLRREREERNKEKKKVFLSLSLSGGIYTLNRASTPHNDNYSTLSFCRSSLCVYILPQSTQLLPIQKPRKLNIKETPKNWCMYINLVWIRKERERERTHWLLLRCRRTASLSLLPLQQSFNSARATFFFFFKRAGREEEKHASHFPVQTCAPKSYFLSFPSSWLTQPLFCPSR